MAERDGAAVDVQPLGIDRQLAQAREHLRGERLVQLDEVDVVERQARRASATLRIAGTGPMPKRSGSTPAVAKPRSAPAASGRAPARSSADVTSTAAAPSLVCDELPAVTVPGA